MRCIFVSLILVAALGCKADHASRVSSQMDERAAPAQARPLPDPSHQANPGSPAALDPRPLVVCFGDSLTAGFGADEGSSYPDFLQKDLDRDGYPYRIVNEGISGNTTKDGLDRIATITALHPAAVILEFGGNDGLRGLNPATTRTNLADMLTAFKSTGTKVILAGITLPPDYGPDYIKEFDANYTALAKQFQIPLLPFLLKNVYGVQGMMQADNTHATAAGNKIVANNLLPYLEPLLRH